MDKEDIPALTFIAQRVQNTIANMRLSEATRLELMPFIPSLISFVKEEIKEAVKNDRQANEDTTS